MDKNDIKVLISNEEIEKRIKELGKQISEDYKGKDIHLICVLKGAIPFMTKLMRCIDNENLTMDCMSVTSYGVEQRQSTGVVKILKDLDDSITGKNVLIVEDILDTGRTLYYLRELFLQRKPNDIKICTMLDKPSRRETDVVADYVGFSIDNVFVLGYGLDYDEYYRNLNFVGYV